MSHAHVERVIGILATDEGMRDRFALNPQGCLQALLERGFELNECERWSIERLDPQALARFAAAIEPRLQKSQIQGRDS